MNNKIILWNINDKVISKSQPRKICITITIQQPQLMVSEIIALRNENLLHVNLKLKLFKKYHTIYSLNVSKIIQHNARKNNSSIIFSEERATNLH